MTTTEILNNAVSAKTELSLLSSDEKNRILIAMADAIEREKELILSENAKDVEAARGSIGSVMLDRLKLDEGRLKGMADGIRDLAKLPDPVGKIISERTTADGLNIRKIRVPLGVVAIIFESRPNVTSDAAALCLKSGNISVLRGGKESYRSCHGIVSVMRGAIKSLGYSENFINIIDDTTRNGATEIMKANGLVDLLIPRGGSGLIKACVENATVPCIETGTGICSVYVDAKADLGKALKIIENAKVQRPSVCNAAEQCLVSESVAAEFLPRMKKLLVDDRLAAGLTPVELRLDEKAAAYVDGIPASDMDFDTEFLDYIMAVKIVSDVKEAAAHIAVHSTHHSEAIVTEDMDAAAYFTSHIDSAALYVNASTRFTDGGCFGLGCEMGISTQKLHARGPMGLEELTSYKYIVAGDGHIRK